jgi:phage FluMu gp28-like protein
MPKIIWERPWLYKKQEDILFNDSRYVFCEASTKSGKTVGCIAWLGEQAVINGGVNRHFWWVAPVYRQTKIAYGRMKASLPSAIYTPNDTDLTLELVNGSIIEFRSAEKPDNLYGEDVWAIVLDEASRMRQAAWVAARSTITATRGPVRAIGNVKGRRNWFYKLSRKAETSDGDTMIYGKITAKDAVAAGVLEQEEIEDARQMMPEADFKELYYCIPSEDGGNPFGLQHIAAQQMDGLSPDSTVVWGWDLARRRDYTVGIGLDIHGRVTKLERFRTSWDATFNRIRSMTGGTPALVDQTGVGDPIVERLIHEGGTNYEGHVFTAASRQALLEGLAVAIQNGEVWFPAESRIVMELEAFEYVHTQRGVKYEAPYIDHDDCVMALALAVWHKRQKNWLLNTHFDVYSVEKRSLWRKYGVA